MLTLSVSLDLLPDILGAACLLVSAVSTSLLTMIAPLFAVACGAI